METNKKLLQLLTPSWLVNVIGISAALLLTAGVAILAQFENSQFRQQFFEVQNAAATEATAQSSYQVLADKFAENAFLTALPMLLAWAGVGIVVYIFASKIIQSFSQAIELHNQMEYVNASRQSLLRQAILHLAIRLVALIGWFVFIKMTADAIIPYAMAAAYVGASEFTLAGIGYLVLSLITIYVTVCVHAVFLRLIALKPRLFGERF